MYICMCMYRRSCIVKIQTLAYKQMKKKNKRVSRTLLAGPLELFLGPSKIIYGANLGAKII